ncbi:MAG: hybrid sensor histidine kinase/response regulator [Gemmatimonadetes bacterium]|nr:hybrid sensor histidine kinase/response regulator [Gemmatimonadota bacterium]
MSDALVPASPTDEIPTMDPSALTRLERFGGKKLLVEMIALYQAAAPERLGAASAGVATGDIAATELALHSLKSSSAQLGAARLGRLSEKGETIARAGTLLGVAEIIRDMEDELVRVNEWLTGVRGSVTS